ncbi:MAG: HAD family hydrolase [Planctomycetota bacterium]
MPELVRPPEPQACVLDLDGTLLDSLRDVAESLNVCLEKLGLPTYPIDACRYMVGEGVPTLCQKAIGANCPELVPRLIELMRVVYPTRATRHTRPYPGVLDLVARLKARGVRLGVLSNKPHELTVRLVRSFWADGTFGAVYGYIAEEHRKPSPVYLRKICAELGVAPAATWLVGDTPIDVATALAAGAIPIGVTWGFRTREELAAAGAQWIFDRPEELG